jgi:hypothetical protein
MGMRIDDVPNRLRRHRLDGRKQAASFSRASAAVDHGDNIVADDKSDVGGCALILFCHNGNGADVGIHTGRNLSHRQRIGRFARPSRRHGRQQHRHQNQTRDGLPPMAQVTRHLITIQKR